MIKKIIILPIFCLLLSFVFQVQAESSLYERARIYFEENDILQKKTRKSDQKKACKVDFLKIALENVGFSPNVKILFVPTPFKDVKAKSWYSPYVQKAYRLGLIEKSENFCPKCAVRKRDVYDFMLRLEGHTIPLVYNRKLKYKDLKTEEERRLVAKILDLGLDEAYSDKIFGINISLDRKELLELVYKFVLLSESEQIKFSPPKEEAQTYEIKISNPNLKNLDYLESVKDQLFNKYLHSKDLDEEDLMYGAIQGFVKAAGDKYTLFFPPVESDDLKEYLEGSFEGIGAYLEQTDEGVIIQSPIKGFPAEKSGVLSGDIIKKVDGKDITGLNLNEIVKLIKGPRGTEVTIEFERKGKAIEIAIVREVVNIPTVTAEVKDDVLIISIAQFIGNTSQKFSDLITEHYNDSIKGIVLDLRSNPGGFLSAAEELLAYWIEENNVTIQVKYKTYTNDITAGKNQKLLGVKTAVLQNKASASASEIIAGTLKDYEKARVFGETSYGKGTVQEIIQYNNGSSLKVTVAEWLTGKGNSINAVGVVADEEVENKKETEEDEVLKAAKKWVLSD